MGPSRAAASGGIAADGRGSNDGEAGDPEFDLLPADQKRKILKQRKMAAEKAPTVKKARRGEAADAEDDDDVVIIGRARAAPQAEFNAETCANAGAAETDDAAAASPMSARSTIAERNSREPRSRACSSAEQRVRDAVKDAARVQREKEQRRKRKGALFEGIAEEPPQTPIQTERDDLDSDPAEADAEIDIEDEEEQYPAKESSEATGRPERPDGERTKVSFVNNGAPPRAPRCLRSPRPRALSLLPAPSLIVLCCVPCVPCAEANAPFLYSVIATASQKKHLLFKGRGKGMQKVSSKLWAELAEELSGVQAQ